MCSARLWPLARRRKQPPFHRPTDGFETLTELSGPHAGPVGRPSPPSAILSLSATTVAHTEQPQKYNPTEKNMRQIAAFGEKTEVEEMSCWWACFVSCFATVWFFAHWFIVPSCENKPLLLTVAVYNTASLSTTGVHVWRMFVLLGQSYANMAVAQIRRREWDS